MAYNQGANNPAAKLSATDVREIRRRRACGVPRVDLAMKYNVGVYTIRDIVEGRTWGWLP